ncbi:MAG TPA: hypothetical protein VFL29_04325 [Candidatus Dormibacteraeota bacterium]|nr:hypothetical protein [Candidatus Dormibacteraeota bacterium]
MTPVPAWAVAGEQIVMSRLLVLQSRRMMLASCLRRSQVANRPALTERVESLQGAADKAHADYKAAVLAWAHPETPQFWMVAYATMIENAESVVDELRTRSSELPISDRMLVERDATELKGIIKRWRSNLMRPQATGA